MKPSEIQAGTTYVGWNGQRRHVVRRDRGDITYDVPEGKSRLCSARAFARWAVREAPPEEATPPTAEAP